jgi:hypothetical protein
MPSRSVPMPVSPASGIDPSSSAFGSTSSATNSSGDSVPNSRARGFRPAAVPNPATGCAVAGLSLDPRTPAGSSSSTTSGGANRAICPLRSCWRCSAF